MDVVRVSREVVDDNREYLPELIAILSKTQRISPRQDDNEFEDGPSQFSNLDEKERRHLIIYSFLALSIVLEDQRDVAAVAVYQLPDSIQIYYAKNLEITDAFRSHVEELASLVRSTARDHSFSKDRFIDEYFTLIRRNCGKKFRKRVNDLKHHLLMKSESGLPGYFYVSSVSSLRTYLQDSSRQNVPFIICHQADLDALNLRKDKNIYAGLSYILETLISKISSISTLQDYVKASQYAYIFGQSSVMDDLRRI